MQFVCHLRQTDCMVLSIDRDTAANEVERRYSAAFQYMTGNGFKPPRHLANLDLLAIDEVFMVPAYIFTLADVILRGAKNDFSSAFGGVPCLLAGDPLQGQVIAEEALCLDQTGKSWGRAVRITLQHPHFPSLPQGLIGCAQHRMSPSSSLRVPSTARPTSGYASGRTPSSSNSTFGKEFERVVHLGCLLTTPHPHPPSQTSTARNSPDSKYHQWLKEIRVGQADSVAAMVRIGTGKAASV